MKALPMQYNLCFSLSTQLNNLSFAFSKQNFEANSSVMNDNTCEGDDYLDYFVYNVSISPVNLVPFFLLVIRFSDLAIPVIQVGHHP